MKREGWGYRKVDVDSPTRVGKWKAHYYKDGVSLCGRSQDNFTLKHFEIRDGKRNGGDCSDCKRQLKILKGEAHPLYSSKFDTPEKRYRKAYGSFKNFRWKIVEEVDNKYLKAIKTDKMNKYMNIDGEIIIEYYAEESEIITQLTHPKKGLTKMKRKVDTKNKLKNIIGNPRYHSGLKATYLKP